MQLFESISGLPNKPINCCQMQPGYVVAPLKQKGENKASVCWTAPHRPARPVLPSFKMEERTHNQQQRHQWFNGWGSFHD